MEQISLKELDDYYYDTLKKCNSSTLSKADDMIAVDVLEDFDVGIHSFMHDTNLKKLYDHGFISEEIMHLSQELREKALAIPPIKWNVEYIRNSTEWKHIIELSDQILKLKNDFNNSIALK